MTERSIPLMQALERRDADTVVATGGRRAGATHPASHEKTSAALREDVSAVRNHLGNVAGQKWLVGSDDAYWLLAGVLGVLTAGGTPVMPANLEPGHIGEIAEGLDGLLLGDEIASLAEAGAASTRDGGTLADAAELILYTSGTSGGPVPVVKPVVCLDAEVEVLEQTFGHLFNAASRVLGTVPPYHIYGLLFRVLWPLCTGRSFAAATVRYPEELARSGNERRIGILVSSPAFLKRVGPILDYDVLHAAGTQIFSSGGPLPVDVAAAHNRRLARPIIEVYGSTETGGIGYRSVLDPAHPPAWTRFSAVRITADNETGVLSVTSPYIPGGFFQTGDTGRVVDAEHFELSGRVDRVVKIEERRISLTEIEERMGNLPTVAGVRLVTIETGARQVLGAVVQPAAEGWEKLSADGKKAVVEELRAALRPYLAAVAIPRRFRFVSALPEDERGKVGDAALRRLFEENAGRHVSPVVLETTRTAGGATLRLSLKRELDYFDGHFEDVPVLPGVAQLGMAIEFATALLPVSGAPIRVEALKFFNILVPDQETTLELVFDAAADMLRFQYFDGDNKYSAGRVVFGGAQ